MLDRLPADILVCLPDFLYSLDDLYSLLRTSKYLYTCCAGTKARLRPAFARRHGQYLFQPHPHLLVAGAARSLADWALEEPNEVRLRRALKGGIEGLFELCREEARLSLDEIRQLHEAKYALLSPASALVDATIGPTFRQLRYEAHPDKEPDWWSMTEWPDLLLMSHWIYCELFHRNLDAMLEPSSSPPLRTLSPRTRMCYMKHCLPSDSCWPVSRLRELDEQAHGYTHASSEGPGRRDATYKCVRYVMHKLYIRYESPLTLPAIWALLRGQTPEQWAHDQTRAGQNPPSTSTDQLFVNAVLHTPAVLFRLMQAGGLAAVQDDVSRLRDRCKGAASNRWEAATNAISYQNTVFTARFNEPLEDAVNISDPAAIWDGTVWIDEDTGAALDPEAKSIGKEHYRRLRPWRCVWEDFTAADSFLPLRHY